MEERLQFGMFARSLAGHDRGKLYVVLDTEGDYVFLTDGSHRAVDRPKKKKRKHIQPDYHADEELLRLREEGRAVRDEDIRRALKSKEEG